MIDIESTNHHKHFDDDNNNAVAAMTHDKVSAHSRHVYRLFFFSFLLPSVRVVSSRSFFSFLWLLHIVSRSTDKKNGTRDGARDTEQEKKTSFMVSCVCVCVFFSSGIIFGN